MVNIFWNQNGAPKHHKNFLHGTLMIRTWGGVIIIFSIIYFVAPCGSSIKMALCPKTTIIAMLWVLPLLRLITSLFGFQLGSFQKQNWSPWKQYSNSANLITLLIVLMFRSWIANLIFHLLKGQNLCFKFSK